MNSTEAAALIPALDVAMLSDRGCQRDLNEDSIGFFQPDDAAILSRKGRLALVADGLGGHRSGEVASAMALQLVSERYFDDATSDDPIASLRAAMEVANEAIFRRSESEAECAGMGCTCTALVIKERTAYCVHVGDSRLYAWHAHAFKQVTLDDTLVGELVRAGMLSDADARHHPSRHRLSRALGVTEATAFSIWTAPFELKPDDAFLLCSDGLYDLVNDQEIAAAVDRLAPGEAAQSLIDLAKERGGYDNISVGIVRVGMMH